MSQQIPNSSLSKNLVKSSHSDSVLALGEALVRELNLGKSVDTLGRWMAHYVAELIEDAKNAKSDEMETKRQLCCDEILKLWTHRHLLPNGQIPFQELGGLEEVLRKLDPVRTERRYFPDVRRSEDSDAVESETNKWFSTAEEVDSSARSLVRYCLSMAAKGATDKSKDWVLLAEQAGQSKDADVSLLRVFFGDDPNIKALDSGELERKQREERIEQLKQLIAHAEEAIGALRCEG